MPRAARTILPGVATHVVKRGNNRAACFFTDGDRLAYLRFLGEMAREAQCQVHAYCVMTNHVHLLLSPVSAEACSLLMKNLGQRYVQRVNRVHGRTGTLWEGRFRASVAATERYVIACYRYIELNPVRAGLVSHPRGYAWSSYLGNAGERMDSLLAPHPAYLALGADAQHAQDTYRGLFDSALDPGLEDDIRTAYRRGRPLGKEGGQTPS
jgi:putative transposase